VARWDRNARHVHRVRLQIPSPQLRQARLLASQSKRTKDCKAMQNKTMHINAKQWKADQCNTERCKTIGNRAMQSKKMQLQFTSVHSTHGHKPESIMVRLQMTIAHGDHIRKEVGSSNSKSYVVEGLFTVSVVCSQCPSHVECLTRVQSSRQCHE
jgi:hypothetical protein